MSYNVLDLCRHVINYSNDNDYGISNLKFQKARYFIQVYFLTNKKDRTPCFDEKIEAWSFGNSSYPKSTNGSDHTITTLKIMNRLKGGKLRLWKSL
jgi:uncharacterized phage-associated protein